VGALSDLMRAYDEITACAPGYVEADNYASGKILEVMSMTRLGRALRQSDIHFNPNILATVIDAVNDRLFISGYDAGSATAELDNIWDENELGLEAPEIHRHALQRGDQYVTVWPDPVTDRPAIVACSPQTTHIFYREDNPRIKDFAARVWPEADEDKKNEYYIRLNLYYDDNSEGGARIERYRTIATYRNGGPRQESEFEPYSDDPDGLGPVIPNPYGEIPVFHFRTKRPYGEPEHLKGYGPQDAINKLVIYMMVATEFQGFPQRAALSESPATVILDEDPLLDISPQNVIDALADSAWGDALHDTDAEHRNLETGSKLESGPAGVWWLPPGIKDIKEFDAADPTNFLEPIYAFVKLIFSTTQTPLHYFEGETGPPPSGESRRLADKPLVYRGQSRQRSFTKTWQEVFGFALKVVGVEAEDIDLTWRPLEDTDTLDMWELVQLKIQVGMDPVDAFVSVGVPQEKAEAYAQTLKEKQQQELDMQKQQMQIAAARGNTSAQAKGKTSGR
jgi:hypothetical protein